MTDWEAIGGICIVSSQRETGSGQISYSVALRKRLDVKEGKDTLGLEELEGRDIA